MPIAAANAQKLHKPDEIHKIMEDSKIGYNIQFIDTVFDCPDLSEKVIAHQYYQVRDDSAYYLKKIPNNPESRIYFDKAEEYFSKQDFDSAMKYYQMAVQIDSMQFASMTYMAQIYGIQKKTDSAMYWYNKVISRNFIDYMAHWFLADLYKDLGDFDKACEEIAIAQVLNRNNPRLKASFDNIMYKSKRANENWCFQPEIDVRKLSDTSVYIGFTKKWMGYALAKAVWDYEPGYRESMGAGESVFSLTEAKECIVFQVTAMEANGFDLKKETPFKYLLAAMEKNMLDEYLLYEILLPQYPIAASNLPPETIRRISNYVLTVRNRK